MYVAHALIDIVPLIIKNRIEGVKSHSENNIPNIKTFHRILNL